MNNVDRLRAQIKETASKAQAIIDLAEKQNRDFTIYERKQIDAHLATIESMKQKIEVAESVEKQLSALAGGPVDCTDIMGVPIPRDFSTASKQAIYRGSGLTHVGNLDTKRLGTAAVEHMQSDSSPYAKSVLNTGSITYGVPVIGELRREGHMETIFQAIPVLQAPGESFRYFRQSQRTNNAAPVAAGALKPTSVFQIESVDDKVHVIAHLSEPVPRGWIDDVVALETFLGAELHIGIVDALEAQLITGNGTGENSRGLLETSGTHVQPWDSSLLVTTRKSITVLEKTGIAPTLWALNPSDWERIELTREGADNASGGYLIGDAGLPVNRAERKLWGVPVALSNSVPEGTGIVGDFNDVAVVMRELIRLDRSENVGDDFQRNQVRLRSECRAGIAVLRPSAFCEVDLTAA